jgi:hypothetical protein
MARSDERPNLNYLRLLCYATAAPRGHVSKVWFDDIVAAKDIHRAARNASAQWRESRTHCRSLDHPCPALAR